MITHIKIIAVLHIVLGCLGVLAGIAMLVFMGGLGAFVGMTDHSHDAIVALPILGGIGMFVCFLLTVISVPGIIAGIGLLKLRPWARIMTIVLSALHLLNVPFGTVLGIYGLWALLSNEGQRLFMPLPARY